MSSSPSLNLFQRWMDLTPQPLIQTGTVDADLGSDRWRVNLDAGGALLMRNPLAIAVGKPVFLQGGEVISEAPALVYVAIEI